MIRFMRLNAADLAAPVAKALPELRALIKSLNVDPKVGSLIAFYEFDGAAINYQGNLIGSLQKQTIEHGAPVFYEAQFQALQNYEFRSRKLLEALLTHYPNLTNEAGDLLVPDPQSLSAPQFLYALLSNPEHVMVVNDNEPVIIPFLSTDHFQKALQNLNNGACSAFNAHVPLNSLSAILNSIYAQAQADIERANKRSGGQAQSASEAAALNYPFAQSQTNIPTSPHTNAAATGAAPVAAGVATAAGAATAAGVADGAAGGGVGVAAAGVDASAMGAGSAQESPNDTNAHNAPADHFAASSSVASAATAAGATAGVAGSAGLAGAGDAIGDSGSLGQGGGAGLGGGAGQGGGGGESQGQGQGQGPGDGRSRRWLVPLLALLLLLGLALFYWLKLYPWPFGSEDQTNALIDQLNEQLIEDELKLQEINELIEKTEARLDQGAQDQQAQKLDELNDTLSQDEKTLAQVERLMDLLANKELAGLQERTLEAQKKAEQEQALAQAQANQGNKQVVATLPKCETIIKQGKMPNLIIASDGSGSMLQFLPDGTMRIEAAIRAAHSLIDNVDKNVPIRLFGIQGCPLARDYGTFSGSQRQALKDAVVKTNPFNARGILPIQVLTPLVSAMRGMASAAPANADSVGILISDGVDTCKGTEDLNLCSVARQIHSDKPRLKIHVVLIGDSAPDAKCVADITGGKVYKPNNTTQLVADLKKAGQSLQRVCQ